MNVKSSIEHGPDGSWEVAIVYPAGSSLEACWDHWERTAGRDREAHYSQPGGDYWHQASHRLERNQYTITQSGGLDI